MFFRQSSARVSNALILCALTFSCGSKSGDNVKEEPKPQESRKTEESTKNPEADGDTDQGVQQRTTSVPIVGTTVELPGQWFPKVNATSLNNAIDKKVYSIRFDWNLNDLGLKQFPLDGLVYGDVMVYTNRCDAQETERIIVENPMRTEDDYFEKISLKGSSFEGSVHLAFNREGPTNQVFVHQISLYDVKQNLCGSINLQLTGAQGASLEELMDLAPVKALKEAVVQSLSN